MTNISDLINDLTISKEEIILFENQYYDRYKENIVFDSHIKILEIDHNELSQFVLDILLCYDKAKCKIGVKFIVLFIKLLESAINSSDIDDSNLINEMERQLVHWYNIIAMLLMSGKSQKGEEGINIPLFYKISRFNQICLDVDLARTLLEKAILFHPWNALTNYLLGSIFLFFGKSGIDYARAYHYYSNIDVARFNEMYRLIIDSYNLWICGYVLEENPQSEEQVYNMYLLAYECQKINGFTKKHSDIVMSLSKLYYFGRGVKKNKRKSLKLINQFYCALSTRERKNFINQNRNSELINCFIKEFQIK